MNCANCWGVLPMGSAASPCRRLSASGALTALAHSAASLSTWALVMLEGASMPYHCVISKPGKPCSATVGTSGNWGRRWVDPVAMQRTLPALMKGSRAAAPTEAASSRPDIRSVIMGPVPR